MVDIAIHKVLNKTRTIDGKSSTIDGTAYTAGQTVTLTLPGARVEKIQKADGVQIIHRGISKNQWDDKDATTTVYDYKKRLWQTRIIGKYTTTSFTNCLNFYTDARLILDDGGSIMFTFQDNEQKVFPMEAKFEWTGGMLHTVDYVIDLVEGYER